MEMENFKNISGTVISSVDARDFIKDGFLQSVTIDDKLMGTVVDFAILYTIVVLACAILTSIYNPNMPDLDPITSFTASLSCISNVGPGLGLVGPAGNFGGYSAISKIIFLLKWSLVV